MKKTIHFACLTVVTGLTMASAVFAQTFSGTFTEVDPLPYADISSQFVASGLSIGGGETGVVWEGATAFCLDYDAKSLSQDPGWLSPTDTFSGRLVDIRAIEAWGRYATPQDVGLAVAQLSYAVDNYYHSTVLTGGAAERRAFAYVLWEIMYDGGTANGFDVRGGNFSNGSGRYPRNLATTWLSEIESAGVNAGYQKQNDWIVLNDLRPDYQDYILLSATPIPVPVPEPSTGVFAVFVACVFVFRRFR